MISALLKHSLAKPMFSSKIYHLELPREWACLTKRSRSNIPL